MSVFAISFLIIIASVLAELLYLKLGARQAGSMERGYFQS